MLCVSHWCPHRKSQVYAHLIGNAMSIVTWARMYEWISLETDHNLRILKLMGYMG